MSQGLVIPEIVETVHMVARMKNLSSDDIFYAIEKAIQKAGRMRYGAETDIRVEIDRKTGAVSLKQYTHVVENVEDEMTQISLLEARYQKEDIQIGDYIIRSLPPIDFGRIASQTAKQVLNHQLKDAERQKQYDEYKDRVGSIVSGVVRRIEFGHVVVELGKTEALLKRSEMIPREHFSIGDRLRAYVLEVNRESRRQQILLSRVHNKFLEALFHQEVPEVYDGVIQVKGVVRDLGSRAKVAVYSEDPSIDPVGTCIGVKASRVQAILNELNGEKIDIVRWSPDLAVYAVNVLMHAEAIKVLVDEEKNKIEVVVLDDYLSLAIGRRGQNIRLASQLIGWNIDVIVDSQETERRQQEMKEYSKLFIEVLDVEDVIAQLLVLEGYLSLEDIAYAPISDLLAIQGFDEDVVVELRERALEGLKNLEQENNKTKESLGIQKDLEDFGVFTYEQLITMAVAGVKCLDDLAGLSTDELLDILGAENVKRDDADSWIMKARESWDVDML